MKILAISVVGVRIEFLNEGLRVGEANVVIPKTRGGAAKVEDES